MNAAPVPGRRRALLPRLLSLVLPYWHWMALAALLGLLTIASSVGLMSLAAYILAAASLQPSIAELQVAIVGVRFFGISRGVFRYLERLVSHETTFRLLGRFREWFYRGLEPAAPSRLADLDSGELLSRITADLETLEKFYLRVLAPPLIAVLTLILSSMLVGAFSFQLGVVLALMMAVTMAAATAGYLLRKPAFQGFSAAKGRIKTMLIDQVQGLADLLAFNAEERFRSALLLQLEQLEQQNIRLAAQQRTQQMLTGWMRDGTVLLVLILAIPQVNAGQIEGVYLGFLAMAVYASFEALNPLPESFQQLELSLHAAERLFQVVDLPPAITEPHHPVILREPMHLELDRVGFRYRAEGEPVLDGISLSLIPGKRIAVVGPSGSGKTTLIRLILRLWEPDQGRIALNGIPVQNLHTEDIRRAFSVVTQKAFLFNATIASNLKLGAPDANMEEMSGAAGRAQIRSFVEGIPEQYDTWLGEGGANLSGGEQQRIALARAYLRPGILLLDEPTSHLDVQTERQVLQALLANTRESLLLVTHRLIGMEQMDEILVLSGGEILERGTHARLMDAGGLYRTMWRSQHEADVLSRTGQ